MVKERDVFKDVFDWLIRLIEAFTFGFIIFYGSVRPTKNSKASLSLLSREQLDEAPLAIIGNIAINKLPPKSNFVDPDNFMAKLFIQQSPRNYFPRGVI